MEYQMFWHIPQQVLKVHISGDIQPGDLSTLSAAFRTYLDAQENPLHVIVDVARVKRFPLNLQSISQNIPHLNHPMNGTVIIYGRNSALFTIVTGLGRLFRRDIHSAVDETAALGMLRRFHPEIPAPPPEED